MREIDDGLDSKTDNSLPKTTSKVKLNINITLEKSIEECLENYFSEIVSTVYEYEAEFEEDQTLDYLLMKRFLNTAYNNLKDLDSSFMDDYLLELKDDLKVLEGVYARFHKKHAVALVAYESIFLEQQSSYVRFKKRLDYNTSTINTLKSTIKSLENQIKDCQREIRLTKIASEKDEKEADLKRYKTYYVDAIHKNATLRDENIAIKKALEEFAKKYESEFLEQYMTYAKEYDRYIKEQLDGYAYEFDKVMWERAESSSAIRSFFIRANIEDD